MTVSIFILSTDFQRTVLQRLYQLESKWNYNATFMIAGINAECRINAASYCRINLRLRTAKSYSELMHISMVSERAFGNFYDFSHRNIYVHQKTNVLQIVSVILTLKAGDDRCCCFDADFDANDL